MELTTYKLPTHRGRYNIVDIQVLICNMEIDGKWEKLGLVESIAIFEKSIFACVVVIFCIILNRRKE